jgi:hypothetical protein
MRFVHRLVIVLGFFGALAVAALLTLNAHQGPSNTAAVTIGDHTVRVDRCLLTLPYSEQSAIVEQIAKGLLPPLPPGYALDSGGVDAAIATLKKDPDQLRAESCRAKILGGARQISVRDHLHWLLIGLPLVITAIIIYPIA